VGPLISLIPQRSGASPVGETYGKNISIQLLKKVFTKLSFIKTQ